MISRRKLLIGSLLAGSVFRRAAAKVPNSKLADLERAHGGRLGVAIVDTASGRSIVHRGDERFALCSTSKFLIAGFVLTRVDRGQESLDRRVAYDSDAIIAHSPVTQAHLGSGMSVGGLCAAAMTLSDNAAANLLFDSLGGPGALTGWLRTIGDDTTRLDRREPALNDVQPGDPRDTTTPVAMLRTMQKLLLGDVLSKASRDQMITWLIANQTGGARLRAGVPNDWRAGDKTGTGNRNETNDIAIFWPPGRAPVLVTAYYAGSSASDDERNAVLAEVGRMVARTL